MFATTRNVTGLADSKPIYWVLPSRVDELVHDAAIDWISAYSGLVPESDTLLLAGRSLMPGCCDCT